MAKKRAVSEYFDDEESLEDLDRIADSLKADSQDKIVDRDTFDLHFNDFIGEATPRQMRLLNPAVFERYVEKNPKVSKQRLFKKAGGEDLVADRKKTARTIVRDEKTYIKKGASKVDLSGYDTKDGKVVKVKDSKYDIVGMQKGKVVYARRTYILIDGKRKLRYRDTKGKFVSVKKS